MLQMLMLKLLNDSGNSCTPQVEMKAVVILSKIKTKVQNIIIPLLEEILLLPQPSLTFITHVLISLITYLIYCYSQTSELLSHCRMQPHVHKYVCRDKATLNHHEKKQSHKKNSDAHDERHLDATTGTEMGL